MSPRFIGIYGPTIPQRHCFHLHAHFVVNCCTCSCLSLSRQEFIFQDGGKHHVIWVPARFSLWSAFCFCLWATFPSASARNECLVLTFPSMSSAEIDRLLRHHPKRTIESINRSVHSSARPFIMRSTNIPQVCSFLRLVWWCIVIIFVLNVSVAHAASCFGSGCRQNTAASAEIASSSLLW